ncbi:zinc ABC transporter substrate-binding protein [Indioceanicola profundi]|uniref:zinc ABC transporter substrate-binding protein n=1 Tax=Indioceanicola profundi TaxID=2220096 RepID=UPI000E6AAB39|nr:zinc ABC transporter substrate-binding protein [Indioceanicola profundi]
MPIRLAPLLALPLLAGFLLAGPARAEAPPPDVVVTVKPLHSLTAAVMQGIGTPHLLVRGAASPHAFSLKPSDARALDGAELVVWVGPPLEAFLERPLTSLAGDADILTLADVPGMELAQNRVGDAWGGGGHGHDHAAHGTDHHHQAGEVDGHIWLDPHNAKRIVAAVADALVRIDPARADTYRANAQDAAERLDTLDREMAANLEPVKDRPFVTFHDAYQYLERRYGLNAVGAITVSPDQRPGARHVAELRNRIRTLQAACVFAEPQFEPALVRTVAEGTDARTGVLDPEGANLTEGPDLYFELMRSNAGALAECLAGS